MVTFASGAALTHAVISATVAPTACPLGIKGAYSGLPSSLANLPPVYA